MDARVVAVTGLVVLGRLASPAHSLRGLCLGAWPGAAPSASCRRVRGLLGLALGGFRPERTLR